VEEPERFKVSAPSDVGLPKKRTRTMTDATYTRRSVLASLLGSAAATAIATSPLHAVAQFANGGQNGRPGAGFYIENFKRQFRVPAMSVAVSRGGRFVFDHAGGMADPQHMAQAQENSLFRIADLSKPITAVAIFTLIEQGKLRLSDKVFGNSAVLGTKFGQQPYKPYVADVAVDHLLTHTSGGWAADANDPMLHNNGWDQAKLIASTIADVPLTSAPGTQWLFSNFGYCVLGRIIEEVTGQPYEAYVQTSVLAACGISGMQIARNSERQRATNEVIYVGQYSEDPYKINVNRMDSADGWIASSTQLVQFLNHVAGAPGIPAILKPETVRLMTTPCPAYPQGDARYARGWMVSSNDAGSWWQSGSLPGCASVMAHNSDGSCLAALCNSRIQPHQEMDSGLYEMMQDLGQRVAG
jgi:CubicO group peptidase (beta-lactamase class C family)